MGKINRRVLGRVGAVLAVACAGCGGGGGGGDGAASYQAYLVSLADTNVNVSFGLQAFGQQLSVASGGTVFSFAETTVMGQDAVVLTAITPSSPPSIPFAKRLEWTDPSLGVRVSSMVADGAGGVLVAGTALGMSAGSYISQPVISRWDSGGNAVWSKTYPAVKPATWNLPELSGVAGFGTSSDVMLGAPVAGKVPVVAGNTVMVLGDDGAPQAFWHVDSQASLQQALSDDTGFTVLGALYDAFYALRFDWSAKLQWATQAAGAVPSGSNVRFSPSYRRADGTILLPYAVKDGKDAANRGGMIALDGSGKLVDHWGYAVTATFHDGTGDRGFDDLVKLEAYVLDEHHVSIRRLYHAPYPVQQDIPMYFLSGIDGLAATDPYSVSSGSYTALPGGGYLTFHQSGQLGIGDPGPTCSHHYAEVQSIAKSTQGLEPVPAYAPFTPTATSFGATALDLAAKTTDMGPATATVIANAGCPGR